MPKGLVSPPQELLGESCSGGAEVGQCDTAVCATLSLLFSGGEAFILQWGAKTRQGRYELCETIELAVTYG